MSFAARAATRVYTKGIDRPSIFESLRARRTFASTDKILLDFSIDKHIMGEEIEVTGTPELVVAVEGTAPVAQIDVIKNSKIVYSVSPNTRAAQFTFRDDAYDGGDSYYYASRHPGGQEYSLGASPIWVKKKS